MFGTPISGFHFAWPKLATGAVYGLPLTLSIGPVLGAVGLAALGASCIGGMLMLGRSLEKRNGEEFSLSIPPI